MNSNRQQRAFTTKLTTKQSKFLELYKENETKTKENKLPNKALAEQAGYKGNNMTLATTAFQTIKSLKRKGIIQSFEEKGLNEDLITDTLKTILNSLDTDNVKASDVVSAIKLAMQARGDLENVVETYEQTIKAELKGLTELQLTKRLELLRMDHNILEDDIVA